MFIIIIVVVSVLSFLISCILVNMIFFVFGGFLLGVYKLVLCCYS